MAHGWQGGVFGEAAFGAAVDADVVDAVQDLVGTFQDFRLGAFAFDLQEFDRADVVFFAVVVESRRFHLNNRAVAGKFDEGGIGRVRFLIEFECRLFVPQGALFDSATRVVELAAGGLVPAGLEGDIADGLAFKAQSEADLAYVRAAIDDNVAV